MINSASLAATSAPGLRPGLVRPAYAGYNFARLPDTVRRLFGLPAGQPLPEAALPAWDGFERVILILIDALGWSCFERFADRAPFLREVQAGGVVSRLTAQFPSTTAAHVTCLHTGLSSSASGVHEWFYYEPEADQVIAPLLYSPAGAAQGDLLARRGLRPDSVFPSGTLYRDLHQRDVASTVFQHRSYAHSTYSTHVTRGAETIAYLTLAEALYHLEARLARPTAPAYHVLYFDAVDSLSHLHGPAAPPVLAEVEALFWQLERFLRSVVGRWPRTLLLLTADHGQVDIDPATTIYLNRRAPGIMHWLRRDRCGRPLLFGGSPRDLFLYVRPEALDEAQAGLAQALDGRATVHRTADLVSQQVFGPSPVSPRLLERVGNLVILPGEGESVFWHEPGRFEQRYRGHHGGLTPDEMHIPLLAYPI